MKKEEIIPVALVMGDGSAPEMMSVACQVAQAAAKIDGCQFKFIETPAGWKAYLGLGDTMPTSSLEQAMKIGTVFFGGVGDPKYDNTIGLQHPEMAPERRALLTLRKEMGLLLNFRPMIYHPELAEFTNIHPKNIPAGKVIEQHWIRFLLEDSYFGNADFLGDPKTESTARSLGVKLREEVTGDEEMVIDIGYYRRKTIEQYFRFAFGYARNLNLPLNSIDKANVIPRSLFWRKIATRIGKEEFPDVSLHHEHSDAATGLLLTPVKLHGVNACGCEHGDNLSDGAAVAFGSMGMMCSSAINPVTGAAMFESGAGTAPTLAGLDVVNPLGRILTGAMMLRHLGLKNGANAIEEAVKRVIKKGYRTADLASPDTSKHLIVGTREMARLVLAEIAKN